MLLVESALPMGALDVESDERWGDDFSVPWREAVAAAADATALMQVRYTSCYNSHIVLVTHTCTPPLSSVRMQCQVMLEYGIRTAWYSANGLKLMSCLPSRAYALRTATLSGVALRLFCLDLAVKYDKVAVSDADAGRKRGGGGRFSGGSKKGRR